MTLTRRDQINPYITKDRSEIRELMHPQAQGSINQSLAEATVPAGCRTRLHRHHLSEEIYHITAGTGQMHLGDAEFSVTTGDSILIPPGTPHCIANTDESALIILCSCAPAYSHGDTELLE